MSNKSNHKTPDSKSDRRNTLKTLLGSAGIVVGSQAVPGKWTQPVISSVVLPAHAQSSPGSGGNPGEGTTPVPVTTQPPPEPSGFGQSVAGPADVIQLFN